jgi:predicted  nucleic acid-binding Zn-ribbon protein
VPHLQALEKARADAAEAGAALKAAEQQLAELETAALRARMEAGSLRARAQDLADSLTALRAATKVRRHSR